MTHLSLERVERIIEELGVKADEWGIDVLTAEQKNVLLPWSARGIIGNGGFKYYYEGNQDPLATARAFRALGFEDVATACERSLFVFPLGRMPLGEPGRFEAFKAVDWDSNSVRELDRTVWRLKWDDLLASIGVYMSRHSAAFRIARG